MRFGIRTDQRAWIQDLASSQANFTLLIPLAEDQITSGLPTVRPVSRIPPTLALSQAVRDSGLSTEAVAALDLAFGAPAFWVTATLLLRRKPLGFVLGPGVLTFLTRSSLVLAPMGLAMSRSSFDAGHALSAIGAGIAAGSAVLLALSLRAGKATPPPV